MTRRESISRLPFSLALAQSYLSGGPMTDNDNLLESAKIAVAAQKTFGLHLLDDIVDAQPGQNVFISPLGVFLALQMAENGAAGATRDAMRKALALPDRDSAQLNSSAAALQSLLKKALKIANALWADQRFTLA